MVILGILAVIFSILLPVLSKVRERAREVRCTSNLHQLSSAFVAFAADHDRRLPGSIADEFDPDPDHHDWLMGNPHDFSTAPQGGTIYKYLQTDGVYRCPSLTENAPGPGAVFGPTSGSNGRFDFAAVESFSGARVDSISLSCRLLQPDGTFQSMLTPLIVEKDASLINGFQLNGSHCSNFIMSHHHRHGAQYAAVDGSVQWVNEPQSSASPRGCQLWTTLSPRGNWRSLGSIRARWGSWDAQ